MDKKAQARDDYQKLQAKIAKQWQTFANTTGREAYQDLMQYMENHMEMYIKYGEELQMPSPDGKGKVPIDLTTAAILLQNRRGMGIVKTYLTSRVDSKVVQSKTK